MPNYEEVQYRAIEDQTYLGKEKMWFDSFARNLPWVREGKNIKELRGRCKGPAVVVGAGPSAQRAQMESLASVRAHVLATDRMLRPLVQAKAKPELSVTVDGAPEIAEFYKDVFDVPAALPVFAHQPIASLVDEVYWYVPAFEDGWESKPRSVTRAVLWMAGHTMAGSAYGNAGGFAWSLAEFMGHDPVILVGMDFSYGPDVTPMQTPYWKSFLKAREGRTADVIKNDFHYGVNPFGNKVLTDRVWEGYRDIFLKGVERSKVLTVNCSPFTSLYGHGIRTMQLYQAVREFGLDGA